MKEFVVSFPYEVGAVLSYQREDGTVRVDKIAEYIIRSNGVYVFLWKDVFEESYFSDEIPLNEIIEKWRPYDEEKDKHRTRSINIVQ